MYKIKINVWEKERYRDRKSRALTIRFGGISGEYGGPLWITAVRIGAREAGLLPGLVTPDPNKAYNNEVMIGVHWRW